MKKQIVLNEDDIRQTIANSFNVEKDKVKLDWELTSPGFDRLCVAIIELPMNDQR